MQHACTRAACSCTWRARRLHVLKENLRLYDSRSTIFTKTSNVSRISNVSRTPLFAIAFFCKKPRLIIGEIRYMLVPGFHANEQPLRAQKQHSVYFEVKAKHALSTDGTVICPASPSVYPECSVRRCAHW